MHELKGTLGSALGKLQADIDDWRVRNARHAVLERPIQAGVALATGGCLVSLVILLFLGLGAMKLEASQGWLLAAVVTCFVGFGLGLWASLEQQKVLRRGCDFELMQGHVDFLGSLQSCVQATAPLELSLCTHFLRDAQSLTESKPLSNQTKYPAIEHHVFPVLEATLPLKDGTSAQLRVTRYHEAEVHSGGTRYDRSTNRIVGSLTFFATSVRNEDLFELVVPEREPCAGLDSEQLTSLGVLTELRSEGDKTVLSRRTQSDSMDLDLSPAKSLLEALSRQDA